MNYDFLYKKAYPIGILSDDNFDFYWMSDEFSCLENVFLKASLDILILTLADIFSKNTPNYRILLSLFGCYYTDNYYHITSNKLLREIKDIYSIELFLNKNKDKSLIIKKLILIINNTNNLSNLILKYPFILLKENTIVFDL